MLADRGAELSSDRILLDQACLSWTGLKANLWSKGTNQQASVRGATTSPLNKLSPNGARRHATFLSLRIWIPHPNFYR